MRIELRAITPDNHEEVRALKVRPDQTHQVARVDKSLADAYVWQAAEFRAAYREGEPVGYVVIFPFEKDGHPSVNIVRLMVDARFQGEGMGRETLRVTLRWIGGLTPRPQQMVVHGTGQSLGNSACSKASGEASSCCPRIGCTTAQPQHRTTRKIATVHIFG